MRHTNVLVLGGSGFIGRHVCNLLTARGVQIVVPTRRRDRAKHLIVLPTCEAVDANVMDDTTLDRLVAEADAVINLVSILHGSEQAFNQGHAELPRRLVAACVKHRVGRLIQMSAIGASASAPSMYLRSRAAGEAHVRSAPLAWTLFRPSVVFGIEDRFLNLFGRLAAWVPVLPIGGADAKFQPVWVEDVAHAIANSLDNDAVIKALEGHSYQLLKGKQTITVKFQAHPGAWAGGVFGVRVMKAEK